MARSDEMIATLIVEKVKLENRCDKLEYEVEVLQNTSRYLYENLTKVLDRLEL